MLQSNSTVGPQEIWRHTSFERFALGPDGYAASPSGTLTPRAIRPGSRLPPLPVSVGRIGERSDDVLDRAALHARVRHRRVVADLRVTTAADIGQHGGLECAAFANRKSRVMRSSTRRGRNGGLHVRRRVACDRDRDLGRRRRRRPVVVVEVHQAVVADPGDDLRGTAGGEPSAIVERDRGVA